MWLVRLIWFLGLNVAGVMIIYYREKIVRAFGKNDIAEKYMGAGGTYNMWVLIGVIVMFVGLLIVLGKFAFLGL